MTLIVTNKCTIGKHFGNSETTFTNGLDPRKAEIEKLCFYHVYITLLQKNADFYFLLTLSTPLRALFTSS